MRGLASRLEAREASGQGVVWRRGPHPSVVCGKLMQPLGAPLGELSPARLHPCQPSSGCSWAGHPAWPFWEAFLKEACPVDWIREQGSQPHFETLNTLVLSYELGVGWG